MLTLIIFFIGVFITYLCSMLTLTNSIEWWWIALIDAGAIIGIILINALIATICCKWLPNKCFEGNKKFYNVSKKECRFYEKIGIKKWKDKNLELGALNGFRKNTLSDPNNAEYLKTFILESKKGLLDHFISMWVSLLYVFVLPINMWWCVGLPVAITSFVINMLPVMILRYNLPRLQTLLKFSERNKTK